MTEPKNSGASLDDVLTYQLDEGDIQLLEAEAVKEDRFAQHFVDDGDKLDVWKEAASHQTQDAPGIFERINQIQSVLAILRACLPEAKNLELLEQQTIDAAQRTAALNALSEGTPGYLQHASEIDKDLSNVEDVLLTLERRVPLSFLRHNTDEQDFGDVALAHYLRFQIQNLKIAPTSWSRIDLLISRLAAAREVSGVFRVRTDQEVAELLSSCVPPSTIKPHVRKAAITYFRNASKRLEEFERVEELFSSGVYVDVLGYKLSLRYDYFDPQVLYASAEFNLALEEWVETTHEVSMRSLDPQFAQAREQVRKIFGNTDSSRPARGPSIATTSPSPAAGRRASKSASKSGKRTSKGESVVSWRLLAAIAGLLAALVWAIPTALSWYRSEQGNLTSVSTSETGNISAVLRSGAWSGSGAKRIFIGHLDSASWAKLDDKQRRDEADAIREKLSHRQVSTGFIYNNDVLAVSIMEGQLRFVE